MAKRAKTVEQCAADLVSELVQIGSHPAQKQQMGKPFPLVLSPAKERVSFVELQEYIKKHHAAIIKAASEVSCVACVVPWRCLCLTSAVPPASDSGSLLLRAVSFSVWRRYVHRLRCSVRPRVGLDSLPIGAQGERVHWRCCCA